MGDKIIEGGEVQFTETGAKPDSLDASNYLYQLLEKNNPSLVLK